MRAALPVGGYHRSAATDGRAKRPAWVEVDLDAVAANVAALAALAGPSALCAVVKADAYGHGSVPVSRAALGAGASWLGVAMAAEAAVLRSAGIDAPILVLSEPSPDELDDVVELGLRASVYRAETVEGLARAVGRAGTAPLPVHLKVDTGMHRVGADPADALALALAIAGRPELVLEAVWTHCAVADEPDNPFTAVQAQRFERVRSSLRAAGLSVPMAHAANSAATLDHPSLRHDLVRCGIAVYGLDPSPALRGRIDLRPALALKARVTLVKVVPAGEALSYGLRHPLAADSVVATVPLGYADGVTRRLSQVGTEVLVGGRRRPMVGTVTMDQLLVDCGPVSGADALGVRWGDEVVLIGEQHGGRIGAEEWAERLDTISYEVVSGISPRVPRRYVQKPSGAV
ncbi:MAG: alanine racemase [Actinobacteria bacterium]|nr:alanine racemase [Actinomycetota bacterium]